MYLGSRLQFVDKVFAVSLKFMNYNVQLNAGSKQREVHSNISGKKHVLNQKISSIQRLESGRQLVLKLWPEMYV